MPIIIIVVNIIIIIIIIIIVIIIIIKSWRQQSPWCPFMIFYDVRVCHHNAHSYRDLTPKQIYKKHEKDKKRQYAEK